MITPLAAEWPPSRAISVTSVADATRRDATGLADGYLPEFTAAAKAVG